MIVIINNHVPDDSQRVESLLYSIFCQDAALQAVIGNIRAGTNNMRQNYELAASDMIEVDPHKRVARSNHRNDRNAQSSDTRFTAGRGGTGVDFR